DGLPIVECGFAAVEQRVHYVLTRSLVDRRHLERRDLLAPDHPDRYEFYLAVLEVIAVIEPVLVMKARDHLGQIRRRYLPGRQLGTQFKSLTVIATLGQLLVFLPLRRHAIFPQIAPATLDEFVDDGVDTFDGGLVGVLEGNDQGPRVLVLHVGLQE